MAKSRAETRLALPLVALMDAEAGNGKRVALPLWPFILNVKNLGVVQFFVKYMTRSESLTAHHLQRNILKTWGSHRSGAAPTPTNLKMNHVANQLIPKILSVQKFSILVLKFKDFLKNMFK